jgi:hypothetical protein
LVGLVGDSLPADATERMLAVLRAVLGELAEDDLDKAREVVGDLPAHRRAGLDAHRFVFELGRKLARAALALVGNRRLQAERLMGQAGAICDLLALPAPPEPSRQSLRDSPPAAGVYVAELREASFADEVAGLGGVLRFLLPLAGELTLLESPMAQDWPDGVRQRLADTLLKQWEGFGLPADWPAAVGRALGGEIVSDQVVESIRSPGINPQRRQEAFALGMSLVGSAMAELSGDQAGADLAWRGTRALAIDLDIPLPERFHAQGSAEEAMPALVVYLLVGPFMTTIHATARVWDESLASLVGAGGMLKTLQLLYLPDPDDQEHVSGYGGYVDATSTFAARAELPVEQWAPIAQLLPCQLPREKATALLVQVMTAIDEHLGAAASAP